MHDASEDEEYDDFDVRPHDDTDTADDETESDMDSDEAMALIESHKKEGKARKALLQLMGSSTEMVFRRAPGQSWGLNLMDHNNIVRGAFVDGVNAGAPASIAVAGHVLRRGDRIIQVNDLDHLPCTFADALEALKNRESSEVILRIVPADDLPVGDGGGDMEGGVEDSIFDEVMREAHHLLNADRSTLFILDEDTGELWSKVAEGIDEVIRFPQEQGLAGHAACTGEMVNVAQAYDDERFSGETDQRTGYRTVSVLCCPIYAENGSVVGVVQAINKRTGDATARTPFAPFTVEDEDTLRNLCSSISGAVRSMQHQADSSVEVELRRAPGQSWGLTLMDHNNIVRGAFVDEVQAGYPATKVVAGHMLHHGDRIMQVNDSDHWPCTFADALNVLKDRESSEVILRVLPVDSFKGDDDGGVESGDMEGGVDDSIFDEVMREAHHLLNADRSTLFILDEDTGELWSKVAEGIDEVIRFPQEQGLAGHAACTGEMVNVAQAYDDERFSGETDQRTGYRTVSVLCCPIYAENGSVIGVVQVSCRSDSLYCSCLNRVLEYALLCSRVLYVAFSGVVGQGSSLYSSNVH